jgi:hypothetical protein
MTWAAHRRIMDLAMALQERPVAHLGVARLGSVVGVQSLPLEGLLIAVDATAVVRAKFRPLDERDRSY